jgi:acyl-[acyl-carrier-protein]-phospholipid O-acyltransferase/long-chain-fatty-acid--[acyl-carrier-protein] ligase
MSAPDASLLARRRFAPLFATQFLGALNDNLMRYAVLFMASFGPAALPTAQAAMMAVVSVGLFTLPYLAFSGVSGQIADAVDKARLARWVKAAEVAIMLVALGGLFAASYPVLLGCVFLMGCHSAVFGPVKYAVLPQHLSPAELMGGTAMVEAGERHAHRNDANPIRSTRDVLRAAHSGRGVWLSILGISWFFAVGAVLLAQFAPLVSGTLGGGEGAVTLFLLVFSLGVASGAIVVNRLLGGEVSARYVPASALGMAAGLLALWAVASGWSEPMASAWDVFDGPAGWALIAALAVIAIAGGMFVVPLYAILQTASRAEERARIIAANNVVNAIVSVALVLVVMGLSSSGVGVSGVVGVLGFSTLAVALISCWLLPETVFKALVRGLLRALYRVEVVGAANLPDPGTPSVVVVNHVSFLDGVLIAAFMPGRPTFAVNTRIARAWWMRPAMMLFDAFPVDPTNPMAAKAMVKAVRDEGRTLVIFPEGRITTTGALMKVFDGPGMVAAKADAPVVPIRIDGAQYTPFSRLKGKVRRRMFPAIRLTVLEPRRFDVVEEGSARERRRAAGRELYDRMSRMVFETSGHDQTLFGALIDAAETHGAKAPILEDVKREPITYSRLLTGSFALGRRLVEGTGEGEAVGLLLPNVNAAVVSFFGLQAHGRVPAMLNYTAGLAALRSACGTAGVRRVVTSRAFVEQAKLVEIVEALGQGVEAPRIVYLEDLAPTIGWREKARALVQTRFARAVHERRRMDPGAPAVILFTSGSEGVPKGVVLSHRNLLANARQLAARVDFNPTDVVLNALPVFHSFGLGGGTLLPLLNGVRVFLYPSPLHYRIVPAVAYDANATILFGTDTFLAGYARMASPYDFYSIRYVFAGAERVKPETRTAFSDKFGLRILEGYGATETSPVIAVNTPMHFRAGTVGRMLPGMEARLEDVPGIDEGGRLFVRGPNVMLGYYLASNPGVLVPPVEGWHDTGDIVVIDDEGFVEIRGRAKRFAKIGGEMVSLPAVEANASKVWAGADNAVVTRPDARKGEQLVLFTTARGARSADFAAWARANGVAELAVPREIRVVDALPVLGTGKVDYVSIEATARAERTEAA